MKGTEPAVVSPLLAVAGLDDQIEVLRHSLEVLGHGVEGGLACVRIAQSLIQENAAWRASVASGALSRELGAERAREIQEGTILADTCVTSLLDLYVECARPLREPIDSLNGEIARLEAERDVLVRALPAAFAQRHRLLQDSSRHPYICRVEQGRCTGCNVQLPTLLAQELLRGQSNFCPRCRRIVCMEATSKEPPNMEPPVQAKSKRGLGPG